MFSLLTVLVFRVSSEPMVPLLMALLHVCTGTVPMPGALGVRVGVGVVAPAPTTAEEVTAHSHCPHPISSVICDGFSLRCDLKRNRG